jgi:hypothetical protein
VLPDDSVLLCGTTSRDGATKGLLTHISAEGKFIDEKYERPVGTSLAEDTRFTTCIPWGDGFALIGAAAGDGWLQKLDRNGDYQWQMRGAAYFAEEAVEMTNHDLVVVTNVKTIRGTTITRLKPEGTTVASYSDSGSAHFIHPLGAATNLRVYVIDPNDGRTRYLTLDGDLKVVTDSPAGQFDTKKAYEKSGGSVILFGGTWGGDATAAVGVRDTHGNMVRYALTPHLESNWIDDAVPTGKLNEFAVIRTVMSFYPGSAGWPRHPEGELFIARPVVAWVTIGPTAVP